MSLGVPGKVLFLDKCRVEPQGLEEAAVAHRDGQPWVSSGSIPVPLTAMRLWALAAMENRPSVLWFNWHGGVWSKVGLCDLGGPFQPLCLHDSSSPRDELGCASTSSSSAHPHMSMGSAPQGLCGHSQHIPHLTPSPPPFLQLPVGHRAPPLQCVSVPCCRARISAACPYLMQALCCQGLSGTPVFPDRR